MRSIVLASRPEVETIYRRTVDALDALLDDDDDEDDEYDEASRAERSEQLGLLLDGLRFCAVAVQALRDASLAPLALDVHERLYRFDAHCEDLHERADDAIRVLLRAGSPVTARIRSLARHDDSGPREAIAAGARAEDPAGRALLDTLSRDPVAAVRAAAKASLAAVAEVPWWSGKWKSDPAARMTEAERDAVGGALRRVSELLDEPPYRLWDAKSPSAAELLKCLEVLPAPLTVEAIEHLCRASERYTVTHLAPMLLLLLRREGGSDALFRLVLDWGSSDTGVLVERTLCAALAEAPRDTRLAFSKRCIAYVSASPPAERRSFGSHVRFVAAIAARVWPSDEDISFVLDALLALDRTGTGEHATDYASASLEGALVASGRGLASIRDRIVEARLAGYPGPWSSFGRRVDSLIAGLPKRLVRKTAEQAVHAEDDSTVEWGLRTLLGAAYSEKRDGAPVERVARLLKNPRWRALIVANHELAPKALPGLRAMLVRDELPYPEAVAVFGTIRRLYGGLAAPRYSAWVYSDDGDPESERKSARDEVTAFLGPTEIAGPPRADEWQALRRARERFDGKDTSELVVYWADTLREGGWTEDERADFDRFLAAFRERPESEVAMALVGSLASKPTLERTHELDEIATRVEGRSRRLVRTGRARVRHLLGLAAAAPTTGEVGALPAGVWEDDDDDE